MDGRGEVRGNGGRGEVRGSGNRGCGGTCLRIKWDRMGVSLQLSDGALEECHWITKGSHRQLRRVEEPQARLS